MTVADAAAKHPDVWRKFSPRQTLERYLWFAGIVFVAAWSIRNLDITWIYFLDAHIQAMDLLERMYPPDWSHFENILDPMIETIHIATIGTMVTYVIALPVASMASTVPWSTSSMASATSLPRKPMERMAMAQMPATGPGPKMATKIKAQTTVLMDLDDTRMKRPMNQVTPLMVVLRAERKATGRAMR